MANTSRITVNIFDGTRNLIAQDTSILVTLRDGHQQIVHRDEHLGSSINFDVEFFNNFGDNYTVIAFAKSYLQAGFHPVKTSPTTPRIVDLMLLPKKNRLNFAEASWAKLKSNHPKLSEILAHSAANDTEARERYEEFLDNEPGSLAAFLSITTALKDIILPVGKSLDYFQEVIWDAKIMKQDRFFAYADEALVTQIKQATEQGNFTPQFGLDINHPGATSSFKQKQFGEANVQFSFHENDRKTIGDLNCVKVELDMDYFQDSLAHFFLEVFPNKISGGKTDPRQIYMLRWIAGRHAGVPDFMPPYTIESRS